MEFVMFKTKELLKHRGQVCVTSGLYLTVWYLISAVITPKVISAGLY